MKRLDILKVIQVLLDGDDLEKVNKILNREDLYDDSWIDLGTFEDEPELQKFVNYPVIKSAFIAGELDYVAFRLDI